MSWALWTGSGIKAGLGLCPALLVSIRHLVGNWTLNHLDTNLFMKVNDRVFYWSQVDSDGC